MSCCSSLRDICFPFPPFTTHIASTYNAAEHFLRLKFSVLYIPGIKCFFSGSNPHIVGSVDPEMGTQSNGN